MLAHEVRVAESDKNDARVDPHNARFSSSHHHFPNHMTPKPQPASRSLYSLRCSMDSQHHSRKLAESSRNRTRRGNGFGDRLCLCRTRLLYSGRARFLNPRAKRSCRSLRDSTDILDNVSGNVIQLAENRGHDRGHVVPYTSWAPLKRARSLNGFRHCRDLHGLHSLGQVDEGVKVFVIVTASLTVTVCCGPTLKWKSLSFAIGVQLALRPLCAVDELRCVVWQQWRV
ncbi:hypothetical protein KC323_g200 [Hortaea werneckii]|nr:hypothetical protein KC323_g200 [Hortaea werneckii]